MMWLCMILLRLNPLLWRGVASFVSWVQHMWSHPPFCTPFYICNFTNNLEWTFSFCDNPINLVRKQNEQRKKAWPAILWLFHRLIECIFYFWREIYLYVNCSRGYCVTKIKGKKCQFLKCRFFCYPCSNTPSPVLWALGCFLIICYPNDNGHQGKPPEKLYPVRSQI